MTMNRHNYNTVTFALSLLEGWFTIRIAIRLDRREETIQRLIVSFYRDRLLFVVFEVLHFIRFL